MRSFRDILNILFIPALLLAVPYILLCIPVFSGKVPFEVTFDSMAPSYTDGELVYYELVNKSDLKVGDLVVYDDAQLENNRIFHRIVEITDSGLITKGDALEFNDPELLKYEAVVGRVTNTKLPMIGPYVKFVNSNIIFIYASIGVWGLYFLISFLIVKKDMKTKKLAKMEALAAQAPVAPAAPAPAPAATTVEQSPAAPAPEAAPQPAAPVAPVPTAPAEQPAAPTPVAPTAPAAETTTETSTTTSA